MDLMNIRRGLMMGTSKTPVYYTKYELTEDTTIYQLLSRINYHVHFESALIMIRANGSVAPQSGSYTMNNYTLLYQGSTVKSCRRLYQNGRVAPNNSKDVLYTNESDIYLKVQDGVLIYTNSTTTSCLGSSGDSVVIAEIPFDYDKYIDVE